MSDHHAHHRRKCRVLAIAAGFAAVFAPASLADVLTVPTDHPTIQAAVDAAANGDEVVVLPGVYSGGDPVVRIANKDVVLRSTAGAAATVIQGDGGRVMELLGTNAATVIEGFTIRNGYDPSDGGAGVLVQGGGPTFRECLFTNNSCGSLTAGDLGGGGMLIQASNPLIERCRFMNNNGGSGGKGGGIAMYASSPVILECRFESNQALPGYGGGLYIGGGSPLIERTLIRGNTATYGGGIRSEFSALTVRSSRISGNGGIFMNGIWTNCSQPPHPTVIDSWICGNAGSQITENPFGDCFGPVTGSIIANACPPCMPTDLDGSGVVGFDDLAILLADWNAGGASDLDLDGTVGFSDLVILLAAWDQWCVGDQIY